MSILWAGIGAVNLTWGIAHADISAVLLGVVFLVWAYLQLRMRLTADDEALSWNAGVRTHRVGWSRLRKVEIDYTNRAVPRGLRLHLTDGTALDVPAPLPADHDDRRELERTVRANLTGDRLVIHPPWGPGPTSRAEPGDDAPRRGR